MQYAVYIVIATGDDADEIVVAARSLVPRETHFTVRTKSDPSESADVELFFRIGAVEDSDAAIAKALRIFGLARTRAGLGPAGRVDVSLEPVGRPEE